MSQEYIEITERTVSEAITVACQKLAVPSERLEYEVIDPGKTGFLGIGSRAAKIRARIRQGMEESTEIDTSAIINDVLKGKGEKKKASEKRPKDTAREEKREIREEKKEDKKENRKNAASEAAPVEPAAAHEEKKPRRESSEKKNSGKKDSSEKNAERGNRERNRGHRRSRRNDREENTISREHAEERNAQQAETRTAPKKRSAVPVLTDEQIEEIKQRADVFLTDVFKAMDLDADVSSKYDKENGMLSIDIKGENMGVLIGKRGQTLDSLQYLVSLVVNKGIDGYIHVKADTENYRERRKKTLENLAKNIASKVKRNRSSVALEPMNPYERRIIHSALQGDRYVTTYSEGEEPYRKVIVTMKEDRS